MNTTRVFSTGTHKGITYTKEDLKRTAEAYNSAKVTAPWTVGHEFAAGDPAAGWLRSLRYEEDGDDQAFLVATSQFNALGTRILGDKTHENKSISFYPPNSPFNPVPGTYFPRHVAMLGAEMPALKNLGTITDFSDTSFSEDFISVPCPCPINYSANSKMEEILEIKAQLSQLATAVKTLTELITEEVAEDSEAERTELQESEKPAEPTELAEKPTECKACASKSNIGSANSAPQAAPMSYSEDALDYKALYEASQKELMAQTEANAAVALAQQIELLYSDGVLNSTEIEAKDLVTCLTKLKLGTYDYTEKNSPEAVIQALVKALESRSSGIEIGQSLEDVATENFSDTHVLESTDTILGDSFSEKVEEIAERYNLSYSQAMSSHIAAEATAKSAKTSYARALASEVKRYSI